MKARPGEIWRKVCFDLVEPTRIALERAIFMALASRDASSRVEAIECIATVYAQEKQALMDAWRKTLANPEAIFRFDVCERDGWRCVLCKHTGVPLQVHHCLPRDRCRKQGQLDLLVDVENGVALCAPCHERVQPQWQEYVAEFCEHIAGCAG